MGKISIKTFWIAFWTVATISVGSILIWFVIQMGFQLYINKEYNNPPITSSSSVKNDKTIMFDNGIEMNVGCNKEYGIICFFSHSNTLQYASCVPLTSDSNQKLYSLCSE